MSALLAPSRRTLPIRRLGAPASASPGPVANATLAWRDDLTATVARFGIRPDDGTTGGPFEAGQYMTVSLEVDGRVVSRPYSPASPPSERDIELLVRLVPGGELTPALWRTKAGDRLRIGRPKGLFRLDRGDPRPHLLLGTGTGVAPLVAMAAAIDARPVPHPAVVLVHGVREPGELAYRDRLEQLARAEPWFHYLPVVSGPEVGGDGIPRAWSGRRGRIDAVLPDTLDARSIDPASTVAYACGSPAMIETVTGVLRRLGLPLSAIRSERYWSPQAARREP